MWFAGKGALVCLPFGHSPDWDLVAEWHGRFHRVQVKTTTQRQPNGNWVVTVCTRGGNQSWNRITKRFDDSRCDLLFVHTGDGRRWMIPAHAVEAATSVTVGSPKYSQWEIEPGEPLARPPLIGRPRLESAPAWRDTQAVNGDAL